MTRLRDLLFSKLMAPLICLACLACLGVIPEAGAAPHSRALRPGAAELLSEALTAVDPSWKPGDITARPDGMDATLCPVGPPARACVHLRLSDPMAGCTGRAAGFWCLSMPADAAAQDLTADIERALADAFQDDPWVAVRAAVASQEPRSSPWPGIRTALLFLGVASLAGWLVGIMVSTLLARAFPRWSMGRRRLVSICIIAGSGASVLMLPFGAWDQLLAWVLLLAAAVPGTAWTWGTRLRGLGSGAILVSATFLLAEVLARWFLPSPPSFPFPRNAVLVSAVPARDDDGAACRVLFGSGESIRDLLPVQGPRGPGERARVLHVGDSMIAPFGVLPDQALPARLDDLDSAADHMAIAVPGTGPAFHLKATRRWMGLLKPDLLVVHLCLNNDLDDVSKAYSCCNGPLFEFGPEGPVDRCPREVTSTVPVGPGGLPPFPLRVLVPVSSLARHLMALFAGAPGAGLGPVGNAEQRLVALLAALRDEAESGGVRLAVVLSPPRLELDVSLGRAGSARSLREEVLATGQRLGIRILDAFPPFRQAIDRNGLNRYFRNDVPGDIHLTPEGHDFQAGWLAPLLVPESQVQAVPQQ